MKCVSVILVFLCLCYNVRARCAYRGECYTTPAGLPKPCPFDEEPEPMLLGLSPEYRDEIFGLLMNRCPHMIYDDEGNIKPDSEILTCCEPYQVEEFSESLLIADGVLGRCPTCLRNFARQICELNCAPDQARFVNVYIEEGTNGTQYVNEVDYRMYTDFMDGAHESCAGVIVPQTGLPAINLMCGNAPVCDAESWFGFTGDMETNPFITLQVNFIRWFNEDESMNARAPPCHETADGEIPCSCMDCVVNCPTGMEPVIPEICTVLNINCIGFSIGLVFFVLALVLAAFLTRKDYRKAQSAEQSSQTKKGSDVNTTTKFFQSMFTKIGEFSASNSVLVLMLTSWITFAMLFGAMNLKLTSNPIELWSADDSRSRIEMNYFNSRFGPFYRAAQVFLQFKGLDPFTVGNVTYGPAFRIEALQEMVKLEDDIIKIGRDTGGVTLEDVCFAPLRPRGTEQRLDQCVSMSVSTYLGDDRNDINNNTYLNRIQNCLNNYLSLDCMADWGGGAEPEIAFGGYEDDILTADTLLITFPINNFLLEEQLRPVLEWEQAFIDLIFDYDTNSKPDYVDVSYSAERSIEDEINRVSQAEAIPILISYILMFIYVTLSLGNVRSLKTWLIDSKVMVAVGSIITVLVAIFCAMGIMGFTGITTTLLGLNVVPFFVLSVGIDNVFLMVNTLHDIQGKLKDYDDYNPNFSFHKKRKFIFGKMMGRVGPSMFVSSVTQITCFAIGSLAKFPAVVTFAIFVSISLGFLFVFQITTVVALLAVDYKRASQSRFDVLCCVQKKILDDDDPLNSETPYQSVITRLMVPYSKFLLQWWVKAIVFILFVGMLCTSIILIPQLEIGLDQEMALPTDSYVYKYLRAIANLMRIGPPVFFVVKSGLNYSNPDHQNVICGGQLCYEDSLNTQIFLASRFSNVTYISRNSDSWLDDFIDWTGLPESCCKYNTTDGSFCTSTDTSPDCAFCTVERGEWNNGLRPSGASFERYIPFFLQDPPTDTCNRGGLASYSSGVNYILDSEGRATVYDTRFMAYHTSATVASSQGYINAVNYAYELSASITDAIQKHTGLDVEVFPYSIFYVFYEQYVTMWIDTFSSIGYCLIGAVFLNLFASGFNFLTTFAVMFTTLMVVLDMMGVMYIWNIQLNAVSCINLIVSIGIAVEFCSHIAYAFATSNCPKDERVADALKSVGATIITGITFTNIPIVVLAFSYTEIIEVFFFRMLFSLVILGFLHGMVFFPVFLSYLNNLTSSKSSK